MIRPDSGIKLPEGFAEQHSKDTTSIDDPAKFRTKAEYFALFEQINNATLAVLAETSNEDMDAPAPESFRGMFPTVGHMYLLLATHPMMHAGQIVPVRRALGKPVVI